MTEAKVNKHEPDLNRADGIKPKRAIQRMQAYHAPREGRRTFVRLDFNENTTGFLEAGPSGLPVEQVMVYPEYEAFTEKLAALWGLEPDQLLLTNGSDEGLFIIPLAYIEPDEDVALIPSPTFALIPQYLAVAQAKVLEVPVNPDMSYDLPALEAALETGVKLAILPSPDNPTGACLDARTVEAWCRRFPRTLFVVDEAYAEYADASVMHLIGTLDNLLVTRTFSKAWGLAGLRLGVVAGPSSLLNALRCVRPPYSVNSAAVWAAERMLEHSERVRDEALATVARKRLLIEALDRRGFEVTSGGGNFFLLSAGIDAQRLCDHCRTREVLIRNRSVGSALGGHPLWGRIRVSAGTGQENEKLLEALEAFRERQALIFDLDDTLVDTSQSFDSVVMQLVERHSGAPLERADLQSLRAEGGFNDDWDAACELLRRRGRPLPLAQLAAEGAALYLAIARTNERLLAEPWLLERLSLRFRLFVATGRWRYEYAPIWGAELDPCFERVYCRDDVPDCAPKPAPDLLQALVKAHGLEGGFYVGNSVDDMRSATAAGLVGIGVTTTMPEALLRKAGASHVVSGVRQLSALFQLSGTEAPARSST